MTAIDESPAQPLEHARARAVATDLHHESAPAAGRAARGQEPSVDNSFGNWHPGRLSEDEQAPSPAGASGRATHLRGHVACGQLVRQFSEAAHTGKGGGRHA